MRLQGDCIVNKSPLSVILLSVLVGLILGSEPAKSADPIATLRHSKLATTTNLLPVPLESSQKGREERSYPEQPPIIPHLIRNYQIDLNSNKCLTCHSRKAAAAAEAPAVSATHYMDREGQVRAFVTTRRYFCNQCHVPQFDVRPPVGNSFEDADSIVERLSKRRGK